MVKSLFIGYNISVWQLYHHVTLQIPKKIEEKNVIKIDFLKTWHCESLYQAPQSWLYWLKEKVYYEYLKHWGSNMQNTLLLQSLSGLACFGNNVK